MGLIELFLIAVGLSMEHLQFLSVKDLLCRSALSKRRLSLAYGLADFRH